MILLIQLSFAAFLIILPLFSFFNNHEKFHLLIFIININLLFLYVLVSPFCSHPVLLAGIIIAYTAVNTSKFYVPQNTRQIITRKSFQSKYIRGIIIMLSTFIIILGAIELTARILIKSKILKYHKPLITVIRKGTADWRMTHIVADEFREPDPVLFWRSRKKYPYNTQGFKGPIVKIPKPEEVFRIICYGDSNTDGSDGGNWPAELHKLLNKKDANYEVLNAGVPGYSSYQGLMRFKQEVAIYEPDLIIVSFGWNDLPGAIGKPDKNYSFSKIKTFMLRVLLKYHFFLSLKYYLDIYAYHPPLDYNNYEPRVSLQDYIDNLNKFLDISQSKNIDIILLTRPHNTKRFKIHKNEAWRKKVSLYNEALLKLARNRKAYYIDINDIFNKNYSHLFIDKCHFTKEGHKKMAEIIYNYIINNLPSF